MASKAKQKKGNAVVVPALMVGISLIVLVAVLQYVNLDVRYGVGYSAVIFASFGGSAFLLFMVPKARAARISRFVKSYIIGGVLGAIGYYVLQYFGIYAAVGIIMFIAALALVKTDSMHPPAMGIVLAFILYHVDYVGVLVVALGVVIMVLVRVVLERAAFIIERDVEEVEEKVIKK
jgi:CBS-domain-containing membrane protein